jgi:hypothetical protein
MCHGIRLLGVLALCLEDAGHLFTLPLGAEVGADSLLQELQATFVLGDLQQLHSATLVGGESGDFTNQVPDELVVGGLLTLALAWLGLKGVGRSLVALLEAGTDLVPWSHSCLKTVNQRALEKIRTCHPTTN